jgi:hypothetical protein
MEQGVSLYIDPSGAQTGGRVVKRELKEIGQAAITTQGQMKDLSDAQTQAGKAAQASAQMTIQQLEALRAKYNPVFAVVQRYKTAQDEIRQSHRLGALSVNEMTTALGRERQAALSTIAAIKGHTTAVVADTSAMRMASFQRRNLIFQLNDVAVSLASGMNPLMVMAQQGSQIGQIYMGQGGVVTALKETANMAGSVAARFASVGIAAGAVALGLAHIKSEAESAMRSSVSWGEVFNATLDVIWNKLKSTFGPTISTLLDPLFYAFDKLGSAAVDLAELAINSFRAFGYDLAMIFDQLPNIVGAAFVGAVNIAIDNLNSLVKKSKEAVNQIIDALNKIPGVDLSRLDTSGQAISRLDNTYAAELAKVIEQRNAARERILSSTPLRDFGSESVGQIGTNRAQSRFADLANLDFGGSIQSANGLSQAIGGVTQNAKQAASGVIDINQQMMDGRRQTLATFEQSASQLRTMKTELKQVQETLAAAAQTPVSEVFGRDIGNAAGVIEAATSSIQKVFAALNEGRITAQTAHESIELIRASLQQLGGDAASIDLFIDKLTKGQLHVGNLESSIKSLSASIMGIPNREISIGVRQYTVPTSGGGSKGINVYGAGADFTASEYNVGGKTIGVYGGNGYIPPQQGLVDPYDTAMMNQTLGYSGARAAGGPVASGQTYLVGEQGPELVTMGGAGMVANTNSTASILSGGRDTLSLMEDHLYNIINELKIHTNYFETADADFDTMITALQAIKAAVDASAASLASSSATSSSGGSGASSSLSSGYSGGWGGNTDSSAMPYNSAVDYTSAYNFMGYGSYNGTGAIGYDTYTITPSVNGPATGIKDLHKPAFATGGQIMPGEDQRVEFFKKGSERVIIVDDKKVSDGRGGQQQQNAERPISLTVNINGGDMADKRSQQAVIDQFRRAVQQAVRS